MAKKEVQNDYFHKSGDKDRGVAAYVSTGSFSKASNITGIPETTLRYWSKQDWWGEAVLRVDKADSDELKSTFTRIAKKATAELEDRLEHGDEIVTKDGEIVNKKISGKELAIIAAVSADKRRQEILTPNTVAIESYTEKLAKMMEDFVRFARAKEIKGNAEDSRETGLAITSERVFEVEQLRDSNVEPAKSGEPQEGINPINSQGSQA